MSRGANSSVNTANSSVETNYLFETRLSILSGDRSVTEGMRTDKQNGKSIGFNGHGKWGHREKIATVEANVHNRFKMAAPSQPSTLYNQF